jgi:hypothetical protein
MSADQLLTSKLIKVRRSLGYAVVASSSALGITAYGLDLGSLLTSSFDWNNIVAVYKYCRVNRVRVEIVPISTVWPIAVSSTIAIGYNPNVVATPANENVVLDLSGSFLVNFSRHHALSFKPKYTAGIVGEPSVTLYSSVANILGSLQTYGGSTLAGPLSSSVFWFRFIWDCTFTMEG